MEVFDKSIKSYGQIEIRGRMNGSKKKKTKQEQNKHNRQIQKVEIKSGKQFGKVDKQKSNTWQTILDISTHSSASTAAQQHTNLDRGSNRETVSHTGKSKFGEKRTNPKEKHHNKTNA
jgi:hypothetical protein